MFLLPSLYDDMTLLTSWRWTTPRERQREREAGADSVQDRKYLPDTTNPPQTLSALNPDLEHCAYPGNRGNLVNTKTSHLHIHAHIFIRLNWYKGDSLGKCLTNAIKNQFADKKTHFTRLWTADGRVQQAPVQVELLAAGKSQGIAIKLQLQKSSGLSFMQLKGKCCVHTAMVWKISIVPAVWWV